jgi:hypothetical protein
MTRRHLPLALALSAALTGCEPDFDSYGHLGKLRVLAIKSEPPAPVSGTSATLAALVYAPPGVAVRHAWSWCPLAGPATDGYPCLLDEAALAGTGAPPFDLGTGETATLANGFPPALLRAVCAGELGGQALPVVPDCRGGLAVTVRLIARTDVDAVEAVRTVRLRPDDAHPDANPTIDGLAASVDGSPRPLDDTGSVILPRAAETTITAAVAEQAAETFTELKEGQAVPARERLSFSWFVEAGETKETRTGFIDGVVPLSQALENRWTIPSPAEDARPSARLVVVARDSRGGVAWRAATVSLGGAL